MEGQEQVPLDVVAKDGDIILHVGVPADDDLPENRMLVSSHVLTRASKIFTALLGPHFLEGQQSRSAGSPQTIRLPDDSGSAMSDLCLVLHGRTPDSGEVEFQPWSMYRLSVVVDKYDLTEHLQWQLQGLLFQCLDPIALDLPQNTDAQLAEDLANVTAAAYHLNNQRFFEITTERLIRETTHPVYRAESGGGENRIDLSFLKTFPVDILQAIEHKRLLAQDRIMRSLPDKIRSVCTDGSCNCSVTGEIPWKAVEDAFQIESWPGHRISIEEAIKCMRRLPGHSRHGCYRAPSAYAIDAQTIEDFEDEIKAMCRGLCLRCARDGGDLMADCEAEEHKRLGRGWEFPYPDLRSKD